MVYGVEDQDGRRPGPGPSSCTQSRARLTSSLTAARYSSSLAIGYHRGRGDTTEPCCRRAAARRSHASSTWSVGSAIHTRRSGPAECVVVPAAPSCVDMKCASSVTARQVRAIGHRIGLGPAERHRCGLLERLRPELHRRQVADTRGPETAVGGRHFDEEDPARVLADAADESIDLVATPRRFEILRREHRDEAIRARNAIGQCSIDAFLRFEAMVHPNGDAAAALLHPSTFCRRSASPVTQPRASSVERLSSSCA